MSDYISEQLLGEILKRLPVKSLGRCRCVCKSWYSLITSPNFISLHMTHSIEANKTWSLVKLSSVTDMTERLVMYNNTNDSFNEHRELDLPIKPSEFTHSISNIQIVGSCDGLVCVSDFKFEVLYVWNPAIEEFVIVLSGESTSAAVFGFDSKKNEYKVVRFVYDYPLMASEQKLIQPLVQIYELSSNVRRTISVNNAGYAIYCFGPQAYLNGVAHWFVNVRREGHPKELRIASFDLGDEEFGDLMLPDALADWNYSNLSLSVCSQLLAVIQYGSCNLDVSPPSDVYHECCGIWVMKEYGVPHSWSKQFTVSLPNHGKILRMLSFEGNGEILLETCKGDLASYDPQTQRITYLEACDAGRSYEVYPYMETLLSPKGLRKMLGKADSANYQEGACVMVEGNNDIKRTEKLKERIEE